jgi:hypothetical protein
MVRNISRGVRAAVFCTALLMCGSFLLFHTAAAKEDPIIGLLRLPAPPPPNPLVKSPYQNISEDFDSRVPPPDDAPLDDLLA